MAAGLDRKYRKLRRLIAVQFVETGFESRQAIGGGFDMWNAGEIRRHLSNNWLKALIEHFLQVVVLPPGLGDVMIGEDLSASRGEKPSAESIQVYFWATSGQAQQWVAVFVGCWLATACHPSVVQR